MNTKVSIVVPTRNERDNLPRLFASLEQYSDNVEVLVCDSASTDGTVEYAKEYADWIHCIELSGDATAGCARNAGVERASYDVIAMLDADTEVTDGWYRELVKSIGLFHVVAGYSPDPDGRGFPRVPTYVCGQDITWPQCNIAYRRSLFDHVGPLREDMQVAEDCEFHYRCAKAGYIIFYNPRMKVWHYQRPNIMGMIRKAVKNGQGRHELNLVHPDLNHRHLHPLTLRNIIRTGFGALGFLRAHLWIGGVK